MGAGNTSGPAVLVSGALGRMGVRVRAALEGHERLRLGAALEAPGHPELGRVLENEVVLGDDPAAALRDCAAAIDFSTPGASLALVRAAAEAGTPCAVGSTGFDAAERDALAKCAREIPIVLAANFSVAVNVLFRLVREAAQLLGEGFDAEIVELHHSAKLDAPSGTALRLAETVAEGRGQDAGAHTAIGRSGADARRRAGEIGVQALRGGDNPGEHSVLFIGSGERLEIAHRAATRDHFARGALRAAEWALAQKPGLYDMEQVLGFKGLKGQAG